ncbi:MAG: dihydrofolate reductase [Bacteroidales bacterium]|nr:dihydrofolate reductase [Bacteroidales bacterium]
MAYKVLLTHRIPTEGMDLPEGDFHITTPEEKHFSTGELHRMIPDCDALIPVFGFPIDRSLIEKGDKLKIIANFGVGFNNIDVAAATEKGIMVTNTPKTVIEPTAELTFSLLLAVTRRIAELDHKLKNKEPVKWEVMANLGHTLEGKTLGIIGMGNIGKSFALKARAFGMNILYYTRSRLSLTDEKTYGARYTELDELIRSSDVVSLHTPLTEDTHHLLDDEAFRKMKQGTFIINTARGAVIHEEALIRHLQNGHLGGAGLDVFEFEPQISEGLLGLDNVVVVPHIGTANYETRKAMGEEAAINVAEYFKGTRPPNLVNPETIENR